VQLAAPGVVGRLKASVNITHSWIGDLRVQLVSPSGRSSTLHGQIGGSQHDLALTLDSESPNSPLATLVGQSIKGMWTLRVADLVARDTGKLEDWSIEVTRA
jgi:subtilisin-like proprotein convertase family protein